MEQWTKFPFSHKSIVRLDSFLAKYGYSPMLSNNAINEWKEFNKELSNGKAMLYTAFAEARRGQCHAVSGIKFYVKDNNLMIYLPTGRVITLPFREEKIGCLERTVCILDDKPLNGDYLFKSICDALQRETLTCVLAKLVSYGCKVNYFTNNQICIDIIEHLPEFHNEYAYIKVYEYSK